MSRYMIRVALVAIQLNHYFRTSYASEGSLTFTSDQTMNLPLVHDTNESITTWPIQTPNMISKTEASHRLVSLEIRKSMYKYDEIKVKAMNASQENPSIGGFVKQTCYDHPFIKNVEGYCIYVNLQFQQSRGMVLFIRPTFLKTKLKEEHEFFEEEEDEEKKKKIDKESKSSSLPFKYLYRMPHQGGIGTISTQTLKLGDLVVSDSALVVIYANRAYWDPNIWKPIQKEMIDLLPIKGRQLFASQEGIGENELDWIDSTFSRNQFTSSEDDEGYRGQAMIVQASVSLEIQIYIYNLKPFLFYRTL